MSCQDNSLIVGGCLLYSEQQLFLELLTQIEKNPVTPHLEPDSLDERGIDDWLILLHTLAIVFQILVFRSLLSLILPCFVGRPILRSRGVFPLLLLVIVVANIFRLRRLFLHIFLFYSFRLN